MDAIQKTFGDQNFFHRFPILHLLRIVRIAFDVRKLVLALLALGLLYVGHHVVDELIPAAGEANDLRYTTPASIQQAPFPVPVQQVQSSYAKPHLFYSPLASISEPVLRIVAGNNNWDTLCYLWTHLIWSLLVWAFFALAICRIAAVEFVTDARASLRDSIKFASQNYKAPLVSALICTCAGLGIWLSLFLFGLLRHIPSVGASIVETLWIIPLLIGLLLGLLTLGSLASWTLSFATISVEGTDGFDGFSRPFSYVFGKPLRYAVYLLLCLGISLVIFPLLEMLIGYGNRLALSAAYPEMEKFLVDSDVMRNHHYNLYVWQQGLDWIIEAFRVSFFFTAGTVIYFLMRKAEDGIVLDEIYMPPKPGESSKKDELPLSGIAATSHPRAGHDAPKVPPEETSSEEEKNSTDD